jgi:protein subunit release factor B
MKSPVRAALHSVVVALVERRAYGLAKAACVVAQDVLDSPDDLNKPRQGMLEWTGFDDIMKRDEKVADHIYDNRIQIQDENEGANGN